MDSAKFFICSKTVKSIKLKILGIYSLQHLDVYRLVFLGVFFGLLIIFLVRLCLSVYLNFCLRLFETVLAVLFLLNCQINCAKIISKNSRLSLNHFFQVLRHFITQIRVILILRVESCITSEILFDKFQARLNFLIRPLDRHESRKG